MTCRRASSPRPTLSLPARHRHRAGVAVVQPDLVDAGGEPEIVQVLTNVRKPLKLGYVMVKNRSQLQLHEGMSAEEAVRAEDSFFANNDAYRDVPKDLLGADALTRRLTSLLVKRIKHVLPQLKWELQEGLAEVHRVGRTVLSPQPCRDAANQTRDPVPRHLRMIFNRSRPQGRVRARAARQGPTRDGVREDADDAPTLRQVRSRA